MNERRYRYAGIQKGDTVIQTGIQTNRHTRLENLTDIHLLGHPKEGLYNSAKQKNSVCLSVCLMYESKL